MIGSVVKSLLSSLSRSSLKHISKQSQVHSVQNTKIGTQLFNVTRKQHSSLRTFRSFSSSDISIREKYLNGYTLDSKQPINKLLKVPNDVVKDLVNDSLGSINHFNFEKENKIDILFANESGDISLEDRKFEQEIWEKTQSVNPGLDENYLKIAHTYSVISMNPQKNKKFSELTVANTLLHALHWSVADLIDKDKSGVSTSVRYEYSNLITNYISTLLNQNGTQTMLLEEPPLKTMKQLGLDEKCLQKTLDTLENVKKSLSLFFDIIHSYYDPKYFKFFKQKFEISIKSFNRKIMLDKNLDDMTTYIDSRAYTAGCYPYTNMKYIFEADAYGINLDDVMKFQEKYNRDYVNPIELNYNKLFGVRNDRYSFKRDIEEDTASSVFIESKNKLDATSLFFGLQRVRKTEKLRLEEVEYRLDLLENQARLDEKPIVKLIRTCNYSELLASSIYYFFDRRHQAEVTVLKALNDPLVEDDNKLEFFKNSF